MRLVLLGLVLVTWVCQRAAGEEVRKWTARMGNFTLEAALVDATADKVQLKKADGSVISVALDQLSLADVRYVEETLRKATESASKLPPALVPVKPANAPATRPAAASVPATSAPAAKTTPTATSAPPLTQPNSSRWQVRPDPGGEGNVSRDISVSFPSGAVKLLTTLTPSRFVGIADGFPTSVQVWDLQSGGVLGPVTLESHASPEPALCPDGDLLAVNPGGKAKLQIWSLKRKAKIKEIDLGERALVQYLGFAGTRRLLVSSGFGKGLRVFDPRSGTETAQIDVQGAGSGRKLAISPGGNYLAVGETNDRPIKLFDIRNGATAGELELPAGGEHRSVDALCFSPDGQEFAVLYRGTNASLACWSLKTGKLVVEHKFERSIGELAAAGQSESDLEFIPGGKGWLVAGKSIVDREQGGPIWTAKSATRESNVVRLLDGERLLVIAGSFTNRKLTIDKLPWSEIAKSAAVVAKGGTAADLGLPAITKATAEGGTQLAVPNSKQDWNAPLDALAPSTGLTPDAIVLSGLPTGLLIAPQGGRVVVASTRVDRTAGTFSGAMISNYACFNLKTGKEDGAIKPGFATRALDVSPDGTRLALVTQPSAERIDIFEFAGGKPVAAMRPYQEEQGLKSHVIWAGFISNDRILTMSGSDGKLCLWSLPDCKLQYTALCPGQKLVPLSPGLKTMIVSAGDVYQMLDTATGAPLGTLEPPDAPIRIINGFAFNASTTKFAAIVGLAPNQVVAIWDLATGQRERQFPIESGESLAWTADDRLLVHRMLSVGAGGTLPPHRSDLFDPATGRVLWRYQLPIGKHGDLSLGGRTWFAASKDYGQPVKLVGAAIPGSDVAKIIAGAPQPQSLLPQGTAVTLDVSVRISGDAIADKVLTDDVRKKMTDYLTGRGLKVQDRSALALRVELRESLTGRLLQLRPVLGGVALRYEVRGTELTCKMFLSDVTRQILWSQQQVIAAREEIPQAGLPKDVSPSDFVRQQQWTDALAWLTGPGLPAEVYDRWVYTGMGESILSPDGEKVLSVDLPGK